MFILGIVGSPAGGKSTVASRLQELGAEWINADLVARGVLEEQSAQHQLIDHFGEKVTDSQGQIDRGKLASLVFGDDDVSRQALRYLEGVIHPRTRLLITERLRKCADEGVVAAILDVPLLFKSGWDQSCDEIWCVDSDPNIRMKRANDRGWEIGELARREANQVHIEEKKRLSNHVIVNDGSLSDLNRSVDRLWKSFISRDTQVSPPSSPHCP
jgi:dephospho-CoA kinase